MSTSRRHTNWARAFSYYRRWTVLAKLHWLPVKYRVHFKLAVITFNAVTTQQPSYLAELLNGLPTSVTSAVHWNISNGCLKLNCTIVRLTVTDSHLRFFLVNDY